ncbi:hypothetical protein DdX_04332 [Ditylenchus destructor]|uniref:Uncharacterized protein n=1 Tax=Ditylenchus destructor TaxID=166010 RepID=A0AAD4N9D4_9BILA|nr:hypothetical protein DdX_04332 [Ditylenchus destructor]
MLEQKEDSSLFAALYTLKNAAIPVEKVLRRQFSEQTLHEPKTCSARALIITPPKEYGMIYVLVSPHFRRLSICLN